MSNGWPIVRLGDVLTPVVREETVDATQEYRLLGVRLAGRGPFLRETLLGAQTAARNFYRVCAGDFIYSRLFACRGAFGVIASDLDGCYVSSEFPTFTAVADRICVDFLRYWFRLPSVLAIVDEDCSGSTPLTRNRFKEQFFMDLPIPLPPLSEQRRIVGRMNELVAEITGAQVLINEQEQEFRRLLLAAFWGVAREARRAPMGEVAPLVRRAVEVVSSTEYPELGIRSFGKGTFFKPPLTGLELGGKRIFRIEPGDLVFSNVFAWEGAIAVARASDAGRVGSHRFITCVPRRELATAQFLCFYFLTEEGLDLIGAASPGGAGRNRTLGLDALARISVPVPPLAAQFAFDELQVEFHRFVAMQGEIASELNAFMSAVLDRAFKGEM